MTSASVFDLVSGAATAEGVRCILIGGFAVNFYKVTRQTTDVDFLIAKEDFERMLPRLEAAGYGRFSSHENFVQLTNARQSLWDIDFMFVDMETIAKIENEGQRIHIAKNEFTVPSLNHLIALKLHAIKSNSKYRYMKDFVDIVDLIRMNELDPAQDGFAALCATHGPEGIHARILELTQ